jgi:Tfp pilus assembly protein PilO
MQSTEMKKVLASLGKVKSRFNSLSKRRRLMLASLAAVLCLASYINLFYKPNTERIRVMKKSIASYSDKTDMLRAQMPPIAIEKKSLADIKKNIEDTTNKIKSIEAGLPPLNQLPRILDDLIDRAAVYKLDFVSIIPTYTKGTKDIYSSLDIDMELYTDYGDLTNFIKYLKDKPSFLYTREITLKERELKKGEPPPSDGALLATVKLASLIIDEPKGRTIASLVPIGVGDIKLMRDPFTSEAKPAPQDLEDAGKGLVLSGVLLRGEKSTAIINNDVYRIGDKVEGKVIESMERTSVILKDKKKKYILTLEDKNKGEKK